MRKFYTWLLFLVCCGAGSAHAGLVRYDVSFLSQATGNLDIGYMIFDRDFPSPRPVTRLIPPPPPPDNIWPDLVSWRFEVDGFVFSEHNTLPDPATLLEVNSAGSIINDLRNFRPPCVSTNGCQDFSANYIGFTRTTGFLVVLHEDQDDTANFLQQGQIVYSGPTEVAVPGPAVTYLLAMGVFAMSLTRRRADIRRSA